MPPNLKHPRHAPGPLDVERSVGGGCLGLGRGLLGLLGWALHNLCGVNAKRASASVHAFNSPMVPFHAHVVLRREAAETNNPIVVGVIHGFELRQFLDNGLDIVAL